MKLYLDDMRTPPGEDWLLVKDAVTFIALLRWNEKGITEVSLDHDLGTPEDGYKVICYIEQLAVHNLTYIPPYVRVHTANIGALVKMTQAQVKINSIRKERLQRAIDTRK